MGKPLTPYNGPPGDDRRYLLPRDRDDLDAAWDRYFAEHPDKDPSHDVSDGSTEVRDNAWEDLPF